MPVSNEELMQLIQKSVITTATGGLLPPDTVGEFLNLVVDQTPVLNNFRVERNIRKSLELDGLEFGDTVIVPGTEAQAPADADVHKPDLPKKTLTPVELVAAVDISYSWLRQNIREENAEQDINNAISKRIGMDLLDISFNGDTALTEAVPGSPTRREKALKSLDGIIKKANADANVNDDVIAADPTWGGSGGEFSAHLKLMPKQYRDDRSSLMHIVSVDTRDDYEDEIASRQTAAADNVLFGDQAVTRHKRVQIVAPFMFPNGTALLTPRRNIAIGFGRDMQFFTENDHRSRKLKITIVTDMDVEFVFGNALVLGQQA